MVKPNSTGVIPVLVTGIHAVRFSANHDVSEQLTGMDPRPKGEDDG